MPLLLSSGAVLEGSAGRVERERETKGREATGAQRPMGRNLGICIAGQKSDLKAEGEEAPPPQGACPSGHACL